MKKLTSESFAAAKAYIMTQGRPLDQARFRFHFEEGDKSAVIQALAPYQNEDGGFGHGLEPDLRTPASSAIATSMGLAILREVDAAGDEPLVGAAIGYLLATYDSAKQVWPIVPPAVEDAPHAPWWTYAESETNFAGFRINPKASLVGHLYHYPTGHDAPNMMIGAAAKSLMAHVETIPNAELGMHDLLALLELAEADNVPVNLRSPLVEKLRRAAGHIVETDPAGWEQYALQPYQVAPSPGSVLASAIDQEAIEANLDYVIERQTASGSWSLSWSWDFVDAAAWAQAEKDWMGYHAVNLLRTLAAYDRLAAA